MAVFRRFSAIGKEGIIEKRDCLFDPNAEKGSSYLKKKDLTGPVCKFPRELTEQDKKLNISDIHF